MIKPQKWRSDRFVYIHPLSNQSLGGVCVGCLCFVYIYMYREQTPVHLIPRYCLLMLRCAMLISVRSFMRIEWRSAAVLLVVFWVGVLLLRRLSRVRFRLLGGCFDVLSYCPPSLAFCGHLFSPSSVCNCGLLLVTCVCTAELNVWSPDHSAQSKNQQCLRKSQCRNIMWRIIKGHNVKDIVYKVKPSPVHSPVQHFHLTPTHTPPAAVQLQSVQ